MKIHYEYELKQQEAKNRIISEFNASGLPVVLFGWSRVQTIEGLIEKFAIRPKYLCDNDPKKQGTTIFGCKVISPDELPRIYSRYNVLVLVFKYFDSIVEQLHGLSIPPEKIYTLDFYTEGFDSASYFKSREGSLQHIYDRLADDKSRRTFEAVINYRIYREQKLLEGIICPVESQYFPDGAEFLFPVGEDEVFVDAGAYRGDTVRAMLQKCSGGSCRAIHSFEPDPENFAALQAFTARWPFVHCHQLGVGAAPATLKFFGDLGVSSYFDENGSVSVQVDALDRVLADVPVTYIKMDVEGAECAALRGAKNLIQSNMPKLAICTYHSDADMVDIPLLIWEMNPNYALYIRHYSNTAAETVCYAILSD